MLCNSLKSAFFFFWEGDFRCSLDKLKPHNRAETHRDTGRFYGLAHLTWFTLSNWKLLSHPPIGTNPSAGDKIEWICCGLSKTNRTNRNENINPPVPTVTNGGLGDRMGRFSHSRRGPDLGPGHIEAGKCSLECAKGVRTVQVFSECTGLSVQLYVCVFMF